MELEDGDLMEDAAAAATPGASGMKNDSRIPIKAKHCWIPSPCSSLEAKPSCVFCRQFYFGNCCIMWFVLIIAV